MKPGVFRDLSQNEVSELLSLTTKQKEVYWWLLQLMVQLELEKVQSLQF
jgi:hypothetical protein